MRISCCAAMYNGQCNDCPVTAPIRPPEPQDQEAAALTKALRGLRDHIVKVTAERDAERKRGDSLWQECENLRADLKYGYDAAYERAAQVCEWADDERGNACARAIRALKGGPQ